MIDGHWFSVPDADPRAVALYLRHYSSAKGKRDPRLLRAHGVGGPGSRLVLLTRNCDALFLWRSQRHRKDGQEGTNCTVFRNESPVLSSLLIREADELAWRVWPGERHFTFVDARKVRSSNPGYCFLQAGWVRLDGRTKSKDLVILEKRCTTGGGA